MNESNIATLSASLDIDCPKCKHRFDLFENDCDDIYFPPIFSNHWDFLNGEEVFCPECEYEFEISEVEWL